MKISSENPAQYFKRYREELGFKNQNDAKSYLAGKDVIPDVDLGYIESLNNRIVDVIAAVDKILRNQHQEKIVISDFCQEHIFAPFKTIQHANLLPRLNNQGRRPEEVLFSWLRGYAVCEYFMPSFAKLFGIPRQSIRNIGDDDLRSIETFRRSPKADLQFKRNGSTIRLEIQSGFQGVNDIKEHKVREARRIHESERILTVCVHIDLFNGQVAFVRLDQIQNDDVNFVTRQQMEGQSVFSIDQNFFKWRLLDSMPPISELELSLS